MTPLAEWSARRRDLYLTTHNTHKGKTPMTRRDSKPQSQQARGPQTHALDLAVTGLDSISISGCKNIYHTECEFWLLLFGKCLLKITHVDFPVNSLHYVFVVLWWLSHTPHEVQMKFTVLFLRKGWKMYTPQSRHDAKVCGLPENVRPLRRE